MANDLPELIARWTPKFSSVIIPMGGVVGGIAPNPERLCIGFSNPGNGIILATPNITFDANYRFIVKPGSDRWLWWQKHGPVVGMGWNFGSNVNPDVIFICEVLRTNVGS